MDLASDFPLFGKSRSNTERKNSQYNCHTMKKQLLLHLFIALLTSLSVTASGGGGGGGGGFGGGGGGGGSKPRAIDTEKVALGRSVFSGRAEMSASVISKDLYLSQARTLVRLQKKIERSKLASQGKAFKPRELAGRMSTKQLSALSYYVKITFDR